MKPIHVFAAILVLFFVLVGASVSALLAATGFTAWKASQPLLWPHWVYAVIGGLAGASLSLKFTDKQLLWIKIVVALLMGAVFAGLSWLSVEYNLRELFVTASVWKAALMGGCTTGLIGLIGVTFAFWGKGDKDK